MQYVGLLAPVAFIFALSAIAQVAFIEEKDGSTSKGSGSLKKLSSEICGE